MRPVVDHVPFAATDLDAARERFERAGLELTYGGEHEDANTEMAQLVLPDGTYLEVLAPTAADGPGWPDGLADDGEPFRWSVETGSVAGECKRVVDCGVEIHGPKRGARTRPDGTRVEYDYATLGPRDERLLPFVVEDRTPRQYRVPDSELYGSPLSGIGRVVLAVADVEAAADLFTDLYRLPSPRWDVDGRFGDLVGFPGQDFLLCEPTDGPASATVDRVGEGPVAVLLSADVDDARTRYSLGDGRTWFDRRVRFFEEFDGQLGVIERG